jgi:hypothetical protein
LFHNEEFFSRLLITPSSIQYIYAADVLKIDVGYQAIGNRQLSLLDCKEHHVTICCEGPQLSLLIYIKGRHCKLAALSSKPQYHQNNFFLYYGTIIKLSIIKLHSRKQYAPDASGCSK